MKRNVWHNNGANLRLILREPQSHIVGTVFAQRFNYRLTFTNDACLFDYGFGSTNPIVMRMMMTVDAALTTIRLPRAIIVVPDPHPFR